MKTNLEGWDLFQRLCEVCVGAGIEVNDKALVYEDADERGRVRIYWYPDTPVGFYEVFGQTVEAALAELEESEEAQATASRVSRPAADFIK